MTRITSGLFALAASEYTESALLAVAYHDATGMKERNPQLKSADVRSILAASAKNIGPVKTDIGAGLVDPLQALTKAGPKSAEAQ